MLVHNGRVIASDLVGEVFSSSATRAFDPSWVARLRARLRSRSLDRALVDGADPAATPQLAARAARLTTRPMRAQTAEALERLAHSEAEIPARRRVLPFSIAVRANSAALQALAARLRGPAPVYARGVAMLRLLVSDGTGPAYDDREGAELGSALRSAGAAIGG